MKMQYLSVLIFAMVIVGSAEAAEVYHKDGNTLDLYGTFNGMRYIFSDDDKNGDRSFIRYGFRGEAMLSNELIGLGTWEQGAGLSYAESEGDNRTFTCLGFVGIKFGDAGSIDYGRNYGVLHDVNAWTDVMPEFGGNTTVTDNFFAGRANSMLTYRNTNFFGMVDGLNFALQYQGKNNSKTNDKKGCSLQKGNGNGYGLSVTYDLSNSVSAGAAVSSSNRTLFQQSLDLVHNQGKKTKAYSLGLKYDTYNVYLAALYHDTQNMTPFACFSSKNYGFAEKAHNLELVAQYQFNSGLRPSLGYIQSCIHGDQKGKRYDIKRYIELGASYKFNKNMSTFVDYRINLLSSNKLSCIAQKPANNIVALGINYMF
ncbi:porin [Sodalis endosymbiont of Henestaris halophilus]|uniref:porin n=1 Tax=Sodalis endosymbiont of Henestaris halophilus TaxID=1929246 RepID=UPI000BC0BB43|nr:porin [Sodalis endosymbiont of Henestaris halophilus]SNC58643.1 Outer membrane protein C precursor [Sodalis endosymbiont of Henestaris halophilus]